MKLPVPKTLTGANSPTILINWAFGIGVIEYPPGRPRRIISAVWSIVQFLIYLGFVKMANYSGIVKIQKFKIDANNNRMTAYLYTVFIAISMYLGQIKAKIFRDNLSKLSAINERLNILGISNDYGWLFKAQIIHLGIAVASIVIITIVDVINIGLDFPSLESHIGFLVISHYSIAFSFIIDYTFGNSVRYFGNRFQRLNEFLIESNLLGKCETTVTQSNDQFPYYFAVIREIHGNDLPSIRAANKQWLLYIIRETRKIHRVLCKTVTELNTTANIQLLFSMTLYFGQLTALFYASYINVFGSSWNKSNFLNWNINILLSLWIIFYAIKIIMIVEACETTSSEKRKIMLQANRTGGLISKLLETVVSCDEDIHDEINTFWLQLLQKPLSFTAGGFFTINYSLVHGIIGSVTTYLVIMIQMESIYEQGNVDFSLNSTILV